MEQAVTVLMKCSGWFWAVAVPGQYLVETWGNLDCGTLLVISSAAGAAPQRLCVCLGPSVVPVSTVSLACSLGTLPSAASIPEASAGNACCEHSQQPWCSFSLALARIGFRSVPWSTLPCGIWILGCRILWGCRQLHAQAGHLSEGVEERKKCFPGKFIFWNVWKMMCLLQGMGSACVNEWAFQPKWWVFMHFSQLSFPWRCS